MEHERMPKPGQLYRHFKNKLYQIITVATHSETGEPLVIYQALYGNFKTYARPFTMFVSEVDKSKYPESVQKYRFELVVFDGEDIVSGTSARQNTAGQATISQTAIGGMVYDNKINYETVADTINTQTKTESTESYRNHQPDAAERDIRRDIINSEELKEGLLEELDTPEEETGSINPILLEFLESDSYQEKLEILLHRKKYIDDKILNDMSVSMDCTLENGNFEDRFQGFVFCLQTYVRFEDKRLR